MDVSSEVEHYCSRLLNRSPFSAAQDEGRRSNSVDTNRKVGFFFFGFLILTIEGST